jgi:hypothetical protein
MDQFEKMIHYHCQSVCIPVRVEQAFQACGKAAEETALQVAEKSAFRTAFFCRSVRFSNRR